MITNIGTVTMYVRDQEEALRFYTEKLGFEKRADNPMPDGGRWLTVAPPPSQNSVRAPPAGGYASAD